MNIMLDLETMGKSAQAAIVAIGAVTFDAQGIQEEFYWPVLLASSMEMGGEVDASTITWWLKQNESARLAIAEPTNALPINVALMAFTTWLDHQGHGRKDRLLWGNGANFDNAILGSAYDRCHLPRPWEFWNDRCFRTVRAENSDLAAMYRNTHHALEDARNQAEHLIRIWAHIKRTTVTA